MKCIDIDLEDKEKERKIYIKKKNKTLREVQTKAEG